MPFDPQTGEWVDDASPLAVPVDPYAAHADPYASPPPSGSDPMGVPPPGAQPHPDSPVAATGAAADSPASQAAPPVAAAPTLAPPIDDSIQGAPQPFDAPHHWFEQSPGSNQGNDQGPQDPYAPAPEDPYASAMASDAISGGSTPDQQQLEAHQQYLGQVAGPPTVEAMQTPDQHAAAVAGNQQYSLDDRMASLDSSNLTPTQKAQVMARMSPEDLSALNIKHEQEKIHWQAAQQLEVARRAQQSAEENLRMYQQAFAKAQADSAQREADAKRLASTKIEHHIGIGEAIARVVLGAIGGMAAQSTGGHNLALEQFQKNVDEDLSNQRASLESQWKGLDQRKGAIADELGRHGDLYRAQETVRISSYDRALQDLQTKAQDYDPNGTTAQRIASTTQQIGGMRQKAVQDAAQQDFKNKLEIGKSQLDAIKADDARRALQETERHNKAGEGLEWSKFGLQKNAAASSKADDQILQPEDFKSLGIAVPPVAMSMKQHGGWLDQRNKTEELAGKVASNDEASTKGVLAAPVEVGTAPDGSPILKTTPLVQADGVTPWRAPDKFHEMLAGAANVNRLSDSLSREIGEWGGQSDITKSPHYQAIKSDYQDLVFALHEAKGVEGFRPGTSDMLHELTGSVDPTSFMRNATPGIQRAKQNVTDDVNQFAVSKNYTGKPIKFPDMSRPAAPDKTAVDELHAQATAKDSYDSQADQEFTMRRTHTSPGDGRYIQDAFGDASPDMTEALRADVVPSKLFAIKRLGEALNNPDITSSDPKKAAAAKSASTAARKALKDASENAPSGYVREMAKRLVFEPIDIGTPEGDGGPQTSTANETAPEVRR